MSRESKNSSLGVTIILIGIIVLLMNFNVLNINMFWGIVRLWPLLFIVMGLSILTKGIRHMNVIIWLVFIGIIIGYSYLNMDNQTWFFSDSGITIDYEVEATTGVIDLDINHGTLNVDSQESDMIEYSIPEVGVKQHGYENGVFYIDDVTSEVITTAFQGRKYGVTIPEGTWEFRLNGGVFSADIDLKEVTLEDLDIDIGVGDLNLYLGEESNGNYNVKLGVGDLKIIVPDSLGVKIILNDGLSAKHIPDRFNESDKTYTSSNYDTADNKITLLIDVGVGNIDID